MASGGSRCVVVKDFTVVPVKFNVTCKIPHYLFIKLHTSKIIDEDKPTGKTLFVLNVPPYCSKSLFNLFSDFGMVLRIYLQKELSRGASSTEDSKYFQKYPIQKGFKVAYVVYKSKLPVKKILQWNFDDVRYLSDESKGEVLTGIKKWCKEYRSDRLCVKKLQQEIDKYLLTFDKEEQKKKEQAKSMVDAPDDVGWVTVTRHGRRKGAQRTETMEKRVLEKMKQKTKEKELLNFYSFQFKESKMEQIAELRRKFDEDKQTIAKMKQARKFKPY